MTLTPKRFGVAFTFAGEERRSGVVVASTLPEHFGKEAILYDKYHEPEFVQADLVS